MSALLLLHSCLHTLVVLTQNTDICILGRDMSTFGNDALWKLSAFLGRCEPSNSTFGLTNNRFDVFSYTLWSEKNLWTPPAWAPQSKKHYFTTPASGQKPVLNFTAVSKDFLNLFHMVFPSVKNRQLVNFLKKTGFTCHLRPKRES